jgi:hypothetical protein
VASITGTEKTRRANKVFFENFKKIDNLGCNFIDRMIILKCISER